jgi:peptidoglycan/xylan/chitin deacetylase (PgdA/CDA1 family)
MNTSANRAVSSPLLSAALAVVLVGLALLAVSSGLISLPTPAPGPTATPTASPSPTDSPSASLVPTFGYPTPSPEPTFTAYVVQSGDTLTSIARAFRTTGRSIAWWNRGTYPGLDPESPGYDPDTLKPGWVLVLIPGMTVDDENPPSPSPAPPTPTPSPSPTPGPTATAVAVATPTPRPTVAPSTGPTPPPLPAAIVLAHGSRTAGRIALTFDMGGRLVPALDIMAWLTDRGVHATIFPTGSTGSTTTDGRAVLGIVAAHPELFDLGNHSWNHPYFTKLSAAEMADQLTRTEAAIAPLAGQSSKPWFRPPYGAYNLAVRQAVRAAGWKYLVTWDVDTIDWRPISDGGPTAADIVAKVTAKAQSGSIILMHLGGYHTLEALPGILAAIEAKGLTPVTLTELLAP